MPEDTKLGDLAERLGAMAMELAERDRVVQFWGENLDPNDPEGSLEAVVARPRPSPAPSSDHDPYNLRAALTVSQAERDPESHHSASRRQPGQPTPKEKQQ